MKRILCSFLACLPCLFSPGLRSQSIHAVLDSIDRNNVQLKVLRLDHEATLLEMKSENALSGPGIEYIPLFAKGQSGLSTSELNVTEEVDFPTLYAARRSQVRLEGEALDGTFQAQRRAILLQAHDLCLDVIRQNQLINLYDRRVRQAEEMRLLFEKKMVNGDANALEMNKIRLELMDARKQKALFESERMETLGALQQLNGGAPVALQDLEFPEQQPPLDIEAAIQSASAANPSIVAERATVKAAEHGVAMSRKSWLPSVNMGFRRTTEGGGGPSQNGFIVGMNFPVFSNNAKVKASRIRQQSAQLQFEDTSRKVEAEMRSVYDEVMKLKSVLDHSDTQLLRETLDLLDKAQQFGEITAIEYFGESGDIYDKLQSHIELHCQYSKLLSQLCYLCE